MNNLGSNAKFIHILANQAAATTTQNSAAVDMQGWDGVVFLGRIATAATTNAVNLAQSTASGGTFSDLAGSEQRNVTDYRIDVYRPRERYLRTETHRGSVALGSQWAIQYRGRSLASATAQYEFHASPTEGTA